jgi:hypothetical protein
VPVRGGHVQRAVPVRVARGGERGGAERVGERAHVVEVAVASGEQDLVRLVLHRRGRHG